MKKRTKTAEPIPDEGLEKRLREAEEILAALRNHQVDAVIGTNKIALLRLKQVEDQLENQIRISANRLEEIETIYQNVPVGLCTLGPDLKIIRINSHLAKIGKNSPKELQGRSIQDLFPTLADAIEENLRQVLQTGNPLMYIELKGESPVQPGIERYWLEHMLPLYDQQGELIGINMVVEDITERKRFEEELKQLNATLEERVAERTRIAEDRAEQLRKMALKLTQVEEKERKRLSRVLHDGLQQLLIGAKFNTRIMRSQFGDNEEVNESFDQLDQILDQSIEASRSLSYELSPSILEEDGLADTLHWLTNRPHMKNLSVNIMAEKNLPDLPHSVKTFLFQSVRELLVNVIKHAGVNEVDVRLSLQKQKYTVEVVDEGAGFDAAEFDSETTGSLGLRSIREKLDLVGGKLVIDSEPGRGSRFTLKVPVEKSGAGTSSANNHEGKSGKKPSG